MELQISRIVSPKSKQIHPTRNGGLIPNLSEALIRLLTKFLGVGEPQDSLRWSIIEVCCQPIFDRFDGD
jgi:hypothetical protein